MVSYWPPDTSAFVTVNSKSQRYGDGAMKKMYQREIGHRTTETEMARFVDEMSKWTYFTNYVGLRRYTKTVGGSKQWRAS
jgi:hypothetical protein